MAIIQRGFNGAPVTSGPPPSPSDNTSAIALHALGNRARKTLADDIVTVVTTLQRRGQPDVSRREIQFQYEASIGKRIEMSTVSARVNDLVAAARLEVSPIKRMCRVNQKAEISPVRVPLQQTRLTA